jgi:hypothetical protein
MPTAEYVLMVLVEEIPILVKRNEFGKFFEALSDLYPKENFKVAKYFTSEQSGFLLVSLDWPGLAFLSLNS